MPGSQLPPLARLFSPKELPGWFNKTLIVPEGCQGVVLDENNTLHTYPPGQHRIFSFWERLTGKSTHLRVGYIPAGILTLYLRAPYLLSGDGVLLDASLSGAAVIHDPGKFLNRWINPYGELKEPFLDLSGDLGTPLLGNLVRQYAANDLTYGLPTIQILAELQPRLAPLLESYGLEMHNLQFLSFARSADRAEIAEKIQALTERLQAVDVQKQMAAIENQTQMDEFIEQIAPEIKKQTGLHPIVSKAQTAADQENWFQRFSAWVTGAKREQPGLKQQALERLYAQNGNRPIPQHPHAHWWLPRTAWITTLLAFGAVITALALQLASDATSETRAGFIFGAWAVILPLMLDSIKALVEKREQIAEERWRLPTMLHLNELINKDPHRADQLVRDHCGQELRHSQEILNDVRSRAYKAGQVDCALRLRDLERKFEYTGSQIQSKDYGQPLYLSDLRLDHHTKLYLFDYDDDLLLYASAVTQKAEILQQIWPTGQMEDAHIIDLEQHLDAFMARFAGRSRLVKITTAN